MRKILHQHTISFKHAFEGLFWALRTQPNFRIHFTLGTLALLTGWYLGISQVEMTILVFAFVLGIAAEMINTSLEAMCDLITQEWKEQAKIAKDVSAGMMLVTAFGTVLIAGLIFWQYVPGIGY